MNLLLVSRQSFRWLGIALVFVLLLVSHESLAAQSSSGRYYYFEGARVPLTENPNLVAVQFDAPTLPRRRNSAADASGELGDMSARVDSPVGNLVFVPVRAGRDPLAVAARLGTRQGIEFASPVYDAAGVQFAETTEFIARFPEGTSDDQIRQTNARFGASIVRLQPHSSRVWILKPNAGNPRSARELANAYVEAGVVEFAEPNFVLRQARPASVAPLAAQLAPSDSNFGLQWSLRNTQQFQGSINGADIKATDAWDLTQGSGSIKIAVIDEGVYAAHPDLAGKVTTGYNAMTGTNDTTPKVNDHHGTGTAGVIAARTNNNSGIAGVCWSCQILPVKVAELDSQGNWFTSTAILAIGIDWAWQNGADILNNSWTMGAPSSDVLLAVSNAHSVGRNNRGSVVVFASGNEDASAVSFPGSLNSYTIAVGATNWCDERKTPTSNPCNNSDGGWGSNYGTALDLVAPGEAIYATCNGNQCLNDTYTYASGTSLAAPLVSGVAGLVLSLNPELTADKVQEALQAGAHDLGIQGRDNETGYGRLDAYRTLASLYSLRLKGNGGAGLVRAGDVIEYRLNYSNTGRAQVNNPQIFVTLPLHTSYLGSTPAFTPQAGNVYRLDIPPLAPGAKGIAKFRVQVLPSAAGQAVTFNANLISQSPEFNAADNGITRTALGIKRDLFLPFIKYLAP